jgi:Flp pilus assembly protein TadG
MNSKGQALVEFVILVPIFFLIIMTLSDFVSFAYNKIKLENELDYITDLYLADKENSIKSYANEQDIEYIISINDKSVNIEVFKDVKFIMPASAGVLENNVRSERTIYE